MVNRAARSILVMGAAVLIAVFSTLLVSEASGSVQIEEVEAGCTTSGDIQWSVSLHNSGSVDQQVTVTIRLAQHIPPSQGGSPHFVLVAGEEVTHEVMVFAGEAGRISSTPSTRFSTTGVDPKANSLRVETEGLNPERSESFPPCSGPVPTLPPPVVPPGEVPPGQPPGETPTSAIGTPEIEGPTPELPTGLPTTGATLSNDSKTPDPIGVLLFLGILLIAGSGFVKFLGPKFRIGG